MLIYSNEMIFDKVVKNLILKSNLSLKETHIIQSRRYVIIKLNKNGTMILNEDTLLQNNTLIGSEILLFLAVRLKWPRLKSNLSR